MEEVTNQTGPRSPGSLNSYAAARGLDPRSEEAFTGYTEALGEYRDAIASDLGIQVTQLHAEGPAFAEERAIQARAA